MSGYRAIENQIKLATDLGKFLLNRMILNAVGDPSKIRRAQTNVSMESRRA
jgi:hypothetical protein